MNNLDQLVIDAQAAFASANAAAALEQAKARFLGKNGLVTEQLKALGGLAPEHPRLPRSSNRPKSGLPHDFAIRFA